MRLFLFAFPPPPSHSFKCQSLACSRPCRFYPALRLPRLVPPPAPSRMSIPGFDAAVFPVNLLQTTDGLVQAFNSLNQSPCTVAAYLQSTCDGGCEHSSCAYEALPSHFLQRSPLVHSCRDRSTSARAAVLTIQTCASATPLCIPS